ncbi:hypothetical protein BN59_02469 [Legionella massiliensis]|uniref:Uncharacterized protein n=1 Tax=Legionella massiliensis TaxID=1034943 RepID=A0A078KYL1_9GAMM|nr:hypothetical protein [Legionella massiliensis]CDZ78162.1 hypothetical protein BN59_02469 [Legionella massiliensis]CEE13900.1 hypothetical protein BN1094_02469 [Legionella massiliensis]
MQEFRESHKFFQKKRPVCNDSINYILGIEDDIHPWGSLSIKELKFFQLQDIITSYDDVRKNSVIYPIIACSEDDGNVLLDELSRHIVTVLEEKYKNPGFGFKEELAEFIKTISESEFLASHQGMKNVRRSASDFLNKTMSIDDILGVDYLDSKRNQSYMVSHNTGSHCHPYGPYPIIEFSFQYLWDIIVNYDIDRERSTRYVQKDRDENAVNLLLDALSRQGLNILKEMKSIDRIDLSRFTGAISTSKFLNSHPGMMDLLNVACDVWLEIFRRQPDRYDEDVALLVREEGEKRMSNPRF